MEDTNRHFQTPKRILNVGNLKPDEVGKKVKKWVDFLAKNWVKMALVVSNQVKLYQLVWV